LETPGSYISFSRVFAIGRAPWSIIAPTTSITLRTFWATRNSQAPKSISIMKGQSTGLYLIGMSSLSELPLNVEKACALVETGFEYVTREYNDGGKIFRKRK
jgi:hypothetical protein